MNFGNLKELVNYLEEYESLAISNKNDLQSFVYWLANKLTTNPREHQGKPIESEENFHNQNIDTQISILIGRMARYAQNYSKKVFANTKIYSLEEFTFLSTLMFKPSLNKAELTRQNLVELTSGSDIIRRLEKKDLVEEFDDPDDKRSKQVRITEFGRITMFQVFKEMETVTEIITGNLMDWEKLYLQSSLNKLDYLHKEIYPEVKKTALAAIKNKYIG